MNDMITRAACEHALRRIAQGDMDGLETIYDKLGRRIYLLAYSILGDTHAAEDVLQDTLLRLSKNAALREDGNALSYILTVARNLALDHWRRRGREIPSEELFGMRSDGREESTETPFSALEALRELDDEERQIVTLKVEGGLRHREIATMIGITQAACEKRYRRALKKLKAYYL